MKCNEDHTWNPFHENCVGYALAYDGAGGDTAGQLWGTTRTSEEAYLKEFLKNHLQTRKRRPQNFTVCDICLDCLHIHTPRVHAREVDTLAGEIFRTPIVDRQPIPFVWLVLCGLLTTGYTTAQRQSC